MSNAVLRSDPVFGISFTEIALIAVVALIVVGPQKLPGMLRTLGEWMRKLRRLTTEVRAQTGIDEILREEGINGVGELRSLLRGEIAQARRNQRGPAARNDPYESAIDIDADREYPPEGVDAYGALPEDLLELNDADAATASDAAPAVDHANAEPGADAEAGSANSNIDDAPAKPSPPAPPRPRPAAPPRPDKPQSAR